MPWNPYQLLPIEKEYEPPPHVFVPRIPFHDMEPGDSVLVPFFEDDNFSPTKQEEALRRLLSKLNIRLAADRDVMLRMYREASNAGTRVFMVPRVDTNPEGVVIDKGIDPPRSMKNLPWDKMEVGDSFFAPDPPYNRQSLRSLSAAMPNKHATRLRTENGQAGIRVWRVEDVSVDVDKGVPLPEVDKRNTGGKRKHNSKDAKPE